MSIPIISEVGIIISSTTSSSIPKTDDNIIQYCFGIKSPDDARLLSSCSDGVIIGSSIVQVIEESSQSKEFDRIGQYISELKQAIS